MTVSAERREGEDAVTVRDDGAGMGVEDLRLALEPFGRAARARAAGVAGIGLGLPLAKALTELHGGRFRLASALGHGTTAEFTLPRAIPAPPTP